MKFYYTTLVFLFVSFGFLAGLSVATQIVKKATPHSKNLASAALIVDPKTFVSPIIEAESAIVFDPSNQSIIFQKNVSERRPLASITKLMTALVAYPYIEANPDKKITITKEDLSTEGEYGLIVGEEWKLSELIGFMLVESSNDAAVSVANSIMPYNQFITKMNDKAKEIGTDLQFSNPSGLDDDSKNSAGATGSAKSVAILVSEILKSSPDTFTVTADPEHTFTSESGIAHKAINTNKATVEIPQLIGGKTGYTDLAGGNLTVIINAGLNKPIIIVVLGSTVDGRFKDTQALASSTIHYFGS